MTHIPETILLYCVLYDILSWYVNLALVQLRLLRRAPSKVITRLILVLRPMLPQQQPPLWAMIRLTTAKFLKLIWFYFLSLYISLPPTTVILLFLSIYVTTNTSTLLKPISVTPYLSVVVYFFQFLVLFCKGFKFYNFPKF